MSRRPGAPPDDDHGPHTPFMLTTLFTADASSKGVAAAIAIRMVSNRQAPVSVFTCDGEACTAVPIDLGIDTPVFVTLYGTGIRHRSSLANVTCTIGGMSVPVPYAGPQPEFGGLDQVNIRLTLNLRGMGDTNLILNVDDVPSNVTRISIQPPESGKVGSLRSVLGKIGVELSALRTVVGPIKECS